MTEPIRSLHINTERTWRGGERQTLLLCAGLVERGHPVTLVCPPGSPLAERAREHRIDVVEQRMRGELDVRAIRALRRLMREGGHQICQMHTSHAHALGVLARGWRTWPRTIVARRVDFSIYRKASLGLNWFKYRFGVDRYFAISDAIRNVLIKDGIPAGRIVTVRSGIPELPAPTMEREEIRARYGFSQTDFVVGAIGHLASHKGQIHLVNALAELRIGTDEERTSNVKALIVGEGELRPELEAAIRQHQLEDRVVLAGFRSDISNHLLAFDAFAMPSIQEGLGTSVLDAMRFGLPIVASRVGGIPEAIHDDKTGLLVPPADPAALARAIERLVEDDRLRARLGRVAQEMAREEFTIERTIERSIEEYRSLIEAVDADPSSASKSSAGNSSTGRVSRR